MPRSGNKPSSLYIGQSKSTPEQAKNYYGSGDFCKKYRKKYGLRWIKENVKKTILLQDLPNQEALDYWETFAIADYRCRFGDRVVNRADGGDGLSSSMAKKLWGSEEYRKKQSEARKGKKKSEEHKRKISEANKRTQNLPELKAKRSEVAKKLWKSPEYRAKILNAGKDKTIYTFRNTRTNQEFTGIRYDFIKKYGLHSAHVYSVIHGKRKHHKNWILVTDSKKG